MSKKPKPLWFAVLLADGQPYNIMPRGDDEKEAAEAAVRNALKDGCHTINKIIKIERVG